MNKQIKKVGYQQDNPIQEMNIKSKDNLMEVLETIDKKSIKIEKIEADVDLEKKSFKKKFPYFFTGTELIGMKLNHIPFLWEPYISIQGLSALAGSSDVGKSSLLRQFAIAIVLKKTEFLGFPLNVRNGRVIYVSTEDNQISINAMLKKQISKDLNPEALKGLGYIFNNDKINNLIEEQLKESSTDAVIIDSFGDIFDGHMNDITSVRRFLGKYEKLAADYNCAIIFLHHTGKRTENGVASKNNLIGSQGFEAKMRLVMELRKGPKSDHRYLWFTKGNYLPEKQKNVAVELLFDDKQEFDFTGQLFGNGNEGGISVDSTREFNGESKSEIIRIATELKDLDYSLDKIRDKLKEIVPRVPSKGTLSNWLNHLNADHSAK